MSFKSSSVVTAEDEQIDLHKACRLGDLRTIKKAWEQKPESINERDSKFGWAPIYRTVICGHVEATKFLLEKKANANVKNNLGETPLHQAADNSQYVMAQLLLEHGADPNIQQNDGDTPLHHAAFRGDVQMIQILLENGGSPNITNTVFGRTPLHYAVDCSYLEAVKIMLQHGANPSIKDRQGKRALVLAQTQDIIVLLKEIEEGGEQVQQQQNESLSSIGEAENIMDTQKQEEEAQNIENVRFTNQTNSISNNSEQNLSQSINQYMQNNSVLIMQTQEDKSSENEQPYEPQKDLFSQEILESEITGQFGVQKSKEQQQNFDNEFVFSTQQQYECDLAQQNSEFMNLEDQLKSKSQIEQKQNFTQEIFYPSLFESQTYNQEVPLHQFSSTQFNEGQIPHRMSQNFQRESNFSQEQDQNIFKMAGITESVQSTPKGKDEFLLNAVELKAVENKIKEISEMNLKIREAVKASIDTAKQTSFTPRDMEQIQSNRQESINMPLQKESQVQTKDQKKQKNSDMPFWNKGNPEPEAEKSVRSLYHPPEMDYSNGSKMNTMISSLRCLNSDIVQFLRECKLEYLQEQFTDQGYDDLQQMVEMTKKGLINDDSLKEIGVQKVGHRARILTYLELKAGLQPQQSARTTRRSITRDQIIVNSNFACCRGSQKAYKQPSNSLIQRFGSHLRIFQIGYPNQVLSTIYKNLQILVSKTTNEFSHKCKAEIHQRTRC